jgi:ATP-dependent Clp protease adaptor protein ClpS
MSSELEHKNQTQEKTRQETRQETKPPAMYKVYLLNDDYTTMEFVVLVLEEIFRKSHVEAVQIMLHVHNNGKGLCGVYTRDIAETKVEAVHDMAREFGCPLMCVLEKE